MDPKQQIPSESNDALRALRHQSGSEDAAAKDTSVIQQMLEQQGLDHDNQLVDIFMNEPTDHSKPKQTHPTYLSTQYDFIIEWEEEEDHSKHLDNPSSPADLDDPPRTESTRSIPHISLNLSEDLSEFPIDEVIETEGHSPLTVHEAETAVVKQEDPSKNPSQMEKEPPQTEIDLATVSAEELSFAPDDELVQNPEIEELPDTEHEQEMGQQTGDKSSDELNLERFHAEEISSDQDPEIEEIVQVLKQVEEEGFSLDDKELEENFQDYLNEVISEAEKHVELSERSTTSLEHPDYLIIEEDLGIEDTNTQDEQIQASNQESTFHTSNTKDTPDDGSDPEKEEIQPNELPLKENDLENVAEHSDSRNESSQEQEMNSSLEFILIDEQEEDESVGSETIEEEIDKEEQTSRPITQQDASDIVEQGEWDEQEILVEMTPKFDSAPRPCSNKKEQPTPSQSKQRSTAPENQWEDRIFYIEMDVTQVQGRNLEEYWEEQLLELRMDTG